MIKSILFTPNVKFYSDTICFDDIEGTIKQEPMIYGGSWDFCREQGGIITNTIMNVIAEDVGDTLAEMALKGYHPVIDTKKYLLMPGMYRNIPGWHCDGVIRDSKGDQPNVDTINESIQHWSCSINEDPELGTEIILEQNTVDVDTDNVWKSVDSSINNMDINTKTATSGMVFNFDRPTLHRVLPAKNRGWSFFFRLSFYHMPVMNEIREQVQVYTDINQGW